MFRVTVAPVGGDPLMVETFDARKDADAFLKQVTSDDSLFEDGARLLLATLEEVVLVESSRVLVRRTVRP